MKLFGYAIPVFVLLLLAYLLGVYWPTPVEFVRSKVGV